MVTIEYKHRPQESARTARLGVVNSMTEATVFHSSIIYQIQYEKHATVGVEFCGEKIIS